MRCPARRSWQRTLWKSCVRMMWFYGRKHGVLAVGKDPVEAFDMIDILNKSAQIYLRARAMGFVPAGLTPEQMEELKKNFIPF